ncbi:MAG TPA: hypothetical protein ENK04_06495 [Gammaproteobacteria bacterium]|nr:hypothetical protein [Gammaproteobacteria bacterium]
MGGVLEASAALAQLAARITDHEEPHQTVLLEIFSALKINTSYPAIPKLFGVLEYSVQAAINSDLPPRQTWDAWLPTLEYTNKRLSQLNWPRSAQTRRHGNVLGGAQLVHRPVYIDG